MENIITYLRSQGNATFEQQAFNEIDNLILSMLAYIDLDGIVPSLEDCGCISVYDASRLYFSAHPYDEILTTKSITRLLPFILREMAGSQRYKSAHLSGYSNKLDKEEGMQFAALCITLDSGMHYLSFRGSDDHMIAWEEDFKMSYMAVPAQAEAVNYLKAVIQENNQYYYVGGHSKGGNLAVYGALFSSHDIQNQIVRIYNNDGPGILPEIINIAEVSRIEAKIIRIIPEFSIFGTLLEQIGSTIIIRSNAVAVMQHDAMTWEIVETQFIRKDKLDKHAEVLSIALNQWIFSFEKKQRKDFGTHVFGYFRDHNILTIKDFYGHGIIKAFFALNPLNPTNRLFITNLIKSFIHSYSAIYDNSIKLPTRLFHLMRKLCRPSFLFILQLVIFAIFSDFQFKSNLFKFMFINGMVLLFCVVCFRKIQRSKKEKEFFDL